MKNNLKITRSALFALAAGAFCLGNSALAQSSEKSEMKSDMKSKKSEMKSDMKMSGKELDSKDKEFLMEAAKGGMMEVAMGKQAANMGKSPAVLKLGKMMVKDHTMANNKLMALASKKGVKIDKGMPSMGDMNEATFDTEWLGKMATDHEKDIAMFEMESKSGMDSDVKAFATKTLPTLKMHMKMVKEAQMKMGPGADKKS